MSIDENKLLVRRFIEEVINTGNIDGIEEFIASDYTEVHEGKRYKIGIQGAKEHILGVRQTYPDLKLGSLAKPHSGLRPLSLAEIDYDSWMLKGDKINGPDRSPRSTTPWRGIPAR